jgi:hypothetical protein
MDDDNAVDLEKMPKYSASAISASLDFQISGQDYRHPQKKEKQQLLYRTTTKQQNLITNWAAIINPYL